MSISKAQIKKAVAFGEQVYTKFLAHTTRQGSTEAVNRILDNETNRVWAFIDAFGEEVDIMVDGRKVLTWKGMTKEQLKHQVNIAFVKTANK